MPEPTSLRTSTHLLDKLRHDLAQLKRKPGDAFAAFNFFATAACVVDWIHPGENNRQRRADLLAANAVLQVCSEITTGILQLELAETRHVALEDRTRRGWFSSLSHIVRKGRPAGTPAEGELFVSLRGDTVQALGRKPGVIELAKRALSFWENYAELKKTEVVRKGSASPQVSAAACALPAVG